MGEPGGASRRKATLRDVADRAGVHVSTASRALDPGQSRRISKATVNKVKRAAEDLGYVRDLVATGLKRGRSNTVGVVVADLENPYNARLIRGVARKLEEHGMVALIVETGEDRDRLERLLNHFMQRRVDAIITAATHLDDRELLDRVVGRSVPVVLAVRGLREGDYSMVVHDDYGGGLLAAQHLIGLGHRSIAQLRGPFDIDTFVRRAEGFAAAAEAAGCDDLSIEETAYVPTMSEGRRLMELTLSRGVSVTGVFAPTDVMAVGAFEAIAGRGLECPGDVSVVGYNDVPLVGHLSPPLSTIRLPSEEVGSLAAEVAVRHIIDPDLAVEEIRLPASLVERRSTAPAPVLD
jgi:LacI family transcriptional regulator